jgi:hypothetical protein
MERHVTPVTHDARARLSPRIAALSRKVVPMKWLYVELARRPLRERIYGVTLADIFLCPARAMRRLREIVIKCLVGSYAY